MPVNSGPTIKAPNHRQQILVLLQERGHRGIANDEVIVKSDPYHDVKKVHMGHLVSDKGDVSPLCAKRPRKINLKRETWTLVKKFVTCRECLALTK